MPVRMRRWKLSAPTCADTVVLPTLPLGAPASQDDVAAVASIAAIGTPKLLPGLTVEAAHAVTSASPSDKHPAMVHEMPFLQSADPVRHERCKPSPRSPVLSN